MYAKDFDNNGSYDAFPALYLPTSQQDTTKKEYPAQTREDAVKQIISLRSKFQNYQSYARATIGQLFSKEQLTGALILKANYLQSSYLKNNGNGKFTLSPLPVQAQFSALNGMLVDDFDGDHNLDVLINGNDYGTEVNVGRYDALNGLLLKGNGHGNFTALSIAESGIFIPGNGKALAGLKSKGGKYLVAAVQNRGPLKIYELKRNVKFVPIGKMDVRVQIEYKNGTSQVRELYNGCSFLSQSSRNIIADSSIRSITIIDNKGMSRKIQ